MNFLERVGCFLYHHYSTFWFRTVTRSKTNALVRKYLGDSVPDIEEIARNRTVLMLINQHFSLTGVKAYAPTVIEVGGLQIEEAKTLIPKMQQILDSSKNGVIYVNWGSMIRKSSLPVSKREAMVKAFGRLKQTVIWKWENDTLPNQPKNVHIMKWTQQREILAHPNVKVFMSHGGLLGTSEATYYGVPIIATPIFGDQFLNSLTLAERGMGITLLFDDLTEENIYNSIMQILQPEFQMKAKLVSDAYRSRPQKPLDTGTWWVERVAATKGNLMNKSDNFILPWYIYYSFDVCAFITVICLVLISIFIYTIKLLCCKSNKAIKIKNS